MEASSSPSNENATPAMTDDSLLPFDLPSIQRKKVSAAFDGGLISSDGGLVLLREVERHLGLAETLAGCIRDRRNQAQVIHALSAMLRFRMLAIACGYEDADDCDALRADPVFKMARNDGPKVCIVGTDSAVPSPHSASAISVRATHRASSTVIASAADSVRLTSALPIRRCTIHVSRPLARARTPSPATTPSHSTASRRGDAVKARARASVIAVLLPIARSLPFPLPSWTGETWTRHPLG